jgi:glycosyltransferase involved in cell wall biosynthesis
MKTKVLFLSAWYPNRYDPMPGLFVKRHAELMTDNFEVAVLHAIAIESAKQPYEIDIITEDQIFTVRVYYRKVKTNIPLISLLFKLRRFLIAHLKGFYEIQKHYGLPNIVHANILTRVGAFAYFLKIRYKIPYVITEHWTRYQAKHLRYNGIVRKFVTNLVVANCSCISAVSKDLKEAMIKCGIKHPNFIIINNIVDCEIFKPIEFQPSNQLKTFSHISCFDNKAKNVFGIIRTVYELSNLRNDFVCLMVGDGPDKAEAERLAEQLGIKGSILKFTGLLEGPALVDLYNQLAFTVLFSNYENMPVVISESLACGKPVISSNVGGIAEIIDSSNGILVESGNEKALTEAIDRMLDEIQKYDFEQIRIRAINLFGREAVKTQLLSLYNFCINK